MNQNKEAGLNYNTATLRVCIDTVKDGGIAGQVYSMRLSRPIEFSDINDFILKIESVLDTQKYPQAFQRKRVFTKRPTIKLSPYVSEDEWLDEEVVSSASGKLSTFVVQILSRMNTTWQGQIDWLDGSEKQRFMSALQFIELVDKRVSESLS